MQGIAILAFSKFSDARVLHEKKFVQIGTLFLAISPAQTESEDTEH